MKAASAATADAAANAVEVEAAMKVLAQRVDASGESRRCGNLVDELRGKLGSGVVVLGAATAEGKVSLIVGVTKDLTGRVTGGQGCGCACGEGWWARVAAGRIWRRPAARMWPGWTMRSPTLWKLWERCWDNTPSLGFLRKIFIPRNLGLYQLLYPRGKLPRGRRVGQMRAKLPRFSSETGAGVSGGMRVEFS